MSWEVVFARQAIKDAKKLVASGLEPRALELLAVLANDPFQKALFALSVVTPWHESGKTEGSKGFDEIQVVVASRDSLAGTWSRRRGSDPSIASDGSRRH